MISKFSSPRLLSIWWICERIPFPGVAGTKFNLKQPFSEPEKMSRKINLKNEQVNTSKPKIAKFGGKNIIIHRIKKFRSNHKQIQSKTIFIKDIRAHTPAWNLRIKKINNIVIKISKIKIRVTYKKNWKTPQFSSSESKSSNEVKREKLLSISGIERLTYLRIVPRHIMLTICLTVILHLISHQEVKSRVNNLL